MIQLCEKNCVGDISGWKIFRSVRSLKKVYAPQPQSAGIAERPRGQAVSAVVRALAEADTLPGHADLEASFHPGRAFVRRVAKHNLWVWFRIDANHVTLMSITDEPPVPFEE